MGLNRILVVDPSVEVREMVRSVATGLGATVMEASDGEAALLSFARDPADLVVMTSPLERLDAPELTAILKGKVSPRARLPVLVLGAEGSAHWRFESFDSGADDYMVKPVDPIELGSRLHAFARVLELEQEVEKAQAEIESLVTTDPATGSYGRRFIHNQIRLEWTRADRYGEALSLVLLEVARARELRERLSPMALDGILREVAERLQDSLRRCDLTARVAWDRFLVMMPNTSTVGAYFAAEKLKAVCCERTLGGEDAPVGIEITLGIATFQDGNFGSADPLIDSAEDALRQARGRGPGSIVLFHPVAAA